MNPISTLHRSLVGLLICLLMAAAPAWAGDDFIRWTNPSGGSWHQPGNWNPERVPGVSDVVLFEVDAEFTVHFESQPYFTTLYVRAGQVTLELGDYGLISAFSEDDRRRVECSSTDAETKLIIRDGYPFDPFIQTWWLQECIVQAGGGQFGDYGTIVFFDHRYPVQVAGVANWYFYVVRKSGVLKVAAGELGWEFGIGAYVNSSSFLAIEGGTFQVDGTIRGLSYYGEGGNLVVNGNIAPFPDEISLGNAFINISADFSSEDIYPHNVHLTQKSRFSAEIIYDGRIQSRDGGEFYWFWTDYMRMYPELVTGVWDSGSGIWSGVISGFYSKISTFVPSDHQPPASPSAMLLVDLMAQDNYEINFDLNRIKSGLIDPALPSGSEIVVVYQGFSIQVWLRVAPDDWCIADQNFDGQINFFDVAEFLRHYNERLPWAELNGDGLINFFDVETFLTAYLSGCAEP